MAKDDEGKRAIRPEPEVTTELLVNALELLCKELNYLSVDLQRIERMLGNLAESLRGRK